MRGDSLRDLYAKTIAVCGLGLLAGAGALVDYWPTGVAMPSVGPAFASPQLASALPVPESALEAPVLDAKAVRASSARRMASASVAELSRDDAVRRAELQLGRTSNRESSFVQAASFDVTPASESHFGELIALAEPRTDVLVAMAERAASDAQIAFNAPADNDPIVATAYAPAPVASSSDEGNGFISGATNAFKKTGSSIASAGSKAGASIVGAFRSAGGIMRRVNPFN